MIHIVIDDDAQSVGMVIELNWTWGTTPGDADIMSLASAILASDAVQNSPQWAGTPSLTSVSVDTQRSLYPTP